MGAMISLIIPVYNSARYISRCLDSVINQTYENIQIICVDDGSTDSSMQILDEYAREDNRFTVIHKRNEGVSLARNVALQNVTGDYIMFVDSDDWIELDTCSVALEAIQRYNADVVMWSYVRELEDESRKKYILESDTCFDQTAVNEKLYRRMVGLYGEETAYPENADALCTVWGKLYKSEIIMKNHLCFPDIREIGTYEDGLFNLNVFSKVHSAIFLNKHLYHYQRSNSLSLTTSYNDRMPEQWSRLFDIIQEHVVSNSLEESFHTALNNRIVFSLIALGINETEKHDGIVSTIRRIKRIISEERYKKAIAEFDFKYLPMHWKLFFACAKTRFATSVYLLLLIIQKIRGR